MFSLQHLKTSNDSISAALWRIQFEMNLFKKMSEMYTIRVVMGITFEAYPYIFTVSGMK